MDQVEAAKAVCTRCEVRAECLEFALITNQDCGVWGGTTEEERRSLRRKWRAQGHELKIKRTNPAATSTSSAASKISPDNSWRTKPEGKVAR